MLSDLFNNEDTGSKMKVTFHSSGKKPFSPTKRNSTNLCGIVNQGATCYLNTLIQTLFHTPEFRNKLFSLGPEELGLSPTTNGTKVRVIPIELQRLFAELLLLDQNACSTNQLTDSFGWNNNEELQQHDVQELNKILFNAIEQSLVSTSQAKLIQNLYRGTYVNKIRCLSCQSVFQREEEFLDLPITVQGLPDLHTSLLNSFEVRENLNGNNQYRCEKCNNQYCDAEKYCQLKHLPPILTFSLLRFTYDLTTYQRIKETSNFEFPLELDLRQFIEDQFKSEISNDVFYTKYELYSVIIHSGSAYGGHYRTYIKDYSNLGSWMIEEKGPKQKQAEVKNIKQASSKQSKKLEKEILLIYCDDFDEASFSDGSSELVNLDYLKYELPIELLKAFIYNKHKYELVKIETICGDLTKTTGMSWNKRFKAKYGPIEKFLRKNDDTFDMIDNVYVKLKEHLPVNLVASSRYSSENNSGLIESCSKVINSEESPTETDKLDDIKIPNELEKDERYHWFDFNDSQITAIPSTQLAKQFEGKESAYMLFYRRKTIGTGHESREPLPEWLETEICKANSKILAQRTESEKKENTINFDCYLETDFYLDTNVLNMHQQFEKKSLKFEIDKRTTTVRDLKEILVNQCMDESLSIDQIRKEAYLNGVFDDEPFYWLLCQRVNTSTELSDSQDNIECSYYIKRVLNDESLNVYEFISKSPKGSLSLVLSKHVDVWPIGDEYEPVRVLVKYFDTKYHVIQSSYTFTKCTLVKYVKEVLSNDYLANQKSDSILKLTLVRRDVKESKSDQRNENNQLLTVYEDMKTLSDLLVQNGDFITIEEHVSMAQKLSNQAGQAPSITSTINLTSIVKTVTDKESQQQQPTSANLLIQKMNEVLIMNFTFDPSKTESPATTDRYFNLSVTDSEQIKSIKAMAFSVFDLATFTVQDNCHLRFIDEESTELETLQTSSIYSLPGVCLHDDSKLTQAIEQYKKNEAKITLLLAPGSAPKNADAQIALKCMCHLSVHNSRIVEVLINLNSDRVSDLTDILCQKLNLPAIEEGIDQYYLKTLDWLGDTENVLNDLSLLCLDVPLKHNDLLVLSKGKLVPPNFFMINIWQSRDITDRLGDIRLNEEDDGVIINDFIAERSRDFQLCGDLMVKNELRLEEVVVEIKSILNIEGEDVNLLMRFMKRLGNGQFQSKKCLLDFNKPIKQLNFKQENDVFVQVIDEEYMTSLNQGIVLIDCIQMSFETRRCSPKSFKQIAWNVNNGATLSSLKESIAKAYDLASSDIFRMSIAKRMNNEKCQWIFLKEMNNSGDANKSKAKAGKKKTGKNQTVLKSNLKLSPFNMDNGDFVVFSLDTPKDGTQVTAEDFMSEIDIEHEKKCKEDIERLRKERSERKSGLRLDGESGWRTAQNRRPEVGISIRIDDFNV